jgi:ribosomal-protein-alanine N-acetyltransferase
MMNIRRARNGDLPSILRIEKKSFARNAWDRESFLDYLAQPASSVFLVATIDGIIVGYALAFHGRVRADIDSVGVAAALLKRVIRSLRQRGFKTVSLNVRPENREAILLYQKLGFQRVRRVSGYYEDGGPAWRMRKSG